MLSLYHVLLAQHARQLTSLACAEQTIAQIHHYFEDVVLENNLAALVIESLPFAAERPMRDVARVRDIGRTACQAFFFVHETDVLNETSMRSRTHHREPVLIKTSTNPAALEERFVVIADARFSALLASVRHSSDSSTGDGKESGIDTTGDEVLWTFEPDIVYSALEYLMARVAAERPLQSDAFSKAVRESVPKATSLQLTVSVTTKLARLLQEQTGREVAVNRIATAIRSSLDLSSVLQTTVAEVGRALKAQHCALRVEGEHGGEPLTHCYFRDEAAEACEQTEVMSDLNAYAVRLSGRHKHYILDGRASTDAAHDDGIRPLAAVPFLYRERFMGILMVRSDDQTRVWGENEVLLMRTVADQVAVAVVQARLFAQMQQQALTDGLTGCVNRRSFEMQLERDIHLATRMRQPVSLIMIDIDHFKRVNDTYGHDAGDGALRELAAIMREELRGVDTAARYGGEEFAIILPQANIEGALIVAERLRARIEVADVPGVGRITASLGVATFPLHATSRDQLVTTTDKALYSAKNSGRNRVATPETANELTDDMFDVAQVAANVSDAQTSAFSHP